MNWPESRKWMNIALMSLMTKGSSMFAPGVPVILVEMNNNSSLVATFLVSIYFLGYAFGPLIVAPLSELYGRVYVYHVGNVTFTLFSIGAALSKNVSMLMAFRFLMGTVGSVPTTIGVGSIVDVMPAEKRGRALSFWTLGPLLGPCIGPVVGGYLIEAVGWRWVYWLLAIMGGTLGILAFLVMRETYAPVLLERKAQRLRKATGNNEFRTAAGNVDGNKRIKQAISRPLKFLLATPIVSIIAFYVGISYGIFYLLIATFSFVYNTQYNFSQSAAGLSFLPAGLGMMVGSLAFGPLQDYLVLRAKARVGPEEKYRSEERLTPWLTVPLGLALPFGLLLYGWTTFYQVHWIVPMAGVAIFSCALIGITMTLQSYQMDAYTKHIASGSAAVALFRSLIGSLMPLGGLKMYDALGLGWGNTLLAFISLFLVLVPTVLYLWGQRLRRRFDPAI
nr:polyamine transporter 3 [Colletotrichum truncatum]KAF6796738.1 polyamine transporter 3 [Colletotrichum truncatum]